MENYLRILIFLSIGFFLKRLKSFPRETGSVLNLIVIYISLPALILLKVPELSFSLDLFVPVLMPWLLLGFSFLLIWGVARFFKWDRQSTGALLLTVPLGNTSFLGIPMVKSFFGEEAISYALIYDQLGSFLGLTIYGSLILACYGKEKDVLSSHSIAKKILTFPPFVALVVALLGKELLISSLSLKEILNPLAATLVPLVMIAVGFQFSFSLTRDETYKLLWGLGIKLVLAPLLALLGSKLIGLKGLLVQVSIFEAAMPPMVSAGALAIIAGLAPRLTSALVALGILSSFLTLPLWYQVLNYYG